MIAPVPAKTRPNVPNISAQSFFIVERDDYPGRAVEQMERDVRASPTVRQDYSVRDSICPLKPTRLTHESMDMRSRNQWAACHAPEAVLHRRHVAPDGGSFA